MEELSYKNLSNRPGQSLLRTQVYEYLRQELKAENLSDNCKLNQSHPFIPGSRNAVLNS
jgi:hypothetical protein